MNKSKIILLLATLTFITQPSPASCDLARFNVRGYPTRGLPLAVAVGDLTNDGKIDFVLPSPSGGYVMIYPGNGAGGFATPTKLATGTYPHDMAIADFNGDGVADLAVLEAASAGIEIFLNNGDGTFAPSTTYPLAGDANFIIVDDFNQDGNLDLAVQTGTVDVYLGTGAGGFSAAITSTGILGTFGITSADFDQDGIPDLATTGSEILNIAHGEGTGHFTSTVIYALDGDGRGVVAADFDHDGRIDLAATSVNIYPNNNTRIFPGRGNGHFDRGQRIVSFAPEAVVAGDFNGDGNIDLVSANYSSSASVTVALGNGFSRFPNQFDVPIPGHQPYTIDLATADFNGDGAPDLVTADYIGQSGTVLINIPCNE